MYTYTMQYFMPYRMTPSVRHRGYRSSLLLLLLYTPFQVPIPVQDGVVRLQAVNINWV